MKLKINNRLVTGQAGQTILELAAKNNITIPSLCYHPDLDVKANCRICVVEIKGHKKLATACSTFIADGMEIYTESPRVQLARRVNLELILGAHTKKCSTCLSFNDCELLHLSKLYGVRNDRLNNRKIGRRTYRFANAVEIDSEQCIDCRNCVDACARQGINYLQISGSGANQEIVPIDDREQACVFCGQCTVNCPAAAAQEQSAVGSVEEALRDRRKTVIAQLAPAVRVSLGEEFGLAPGTNCEGEIHSVLQKLGFAKSIDINFGADITTLVESAELIERLRDKKAVWPMMTSCCPAWVAYVEHYHPELIPNLTASRSPHIHSAGLVKAYWAQNQGLKSSDIVVVSIVPCTAKKYEASRSELSFKGQPLVDYVLTTRELTYLIKKNKIDFKTVKPNTNNCLFNLGSGAAAIYAASGGVMESALRTTLAFLTANSKDAKLDKTWEFKQVRGVDGLRESQLNLAGTKLKIAVVNGLKNFADILPKLAKYHYVEVMACPGGCLGGGGQPLFGTADLKLKRSAALYRIDKGRTIRSAHKNREAVAYHDWVRDHNLTAKLLHTKYKKNSNNYLKVAK